MRTIPVSIYFMWEWWDAYYHVRHPRPVQPGDDALDAMYLGRQRFLFEQFDAFELGREHPAMDGQFVNTVIRYGFDLVPVLLGIQVFPIEVGGWQAVPINEEQAARLRPVDVADHTEGEWLLNEIEHKRARYGSVSNGIDIGSAMNNAFRIRGQEIYADLLLQPELARHLFTVIIETERSLYRFLREHFPPMDPVPISNCNVTMLSPEVYVEHVLPFDQQQNCFYTEITGDLPRAALHHCDVPAETFFNAYSQLPGMASLQASLESDIAGWKTLCPGSTFSAMLNPQLMSSDPALVHARVLRALQAGADDLCLWNIDPSLTPAQVNTLLATVARACEEAACTPAFTVIPFCWDEIEWAFPRYQEQLNRATA